MLARVMKKIYRGLRRRLHSQLVSAGRYPQRPNPIGSIRPWRAVLDRLFFGVVSFSQQGEDLVIDRILRRKLDYNFSNQGFYIDVGAYHPVSYSTTYLLYLNGWSGICIDISPESCSLLAKRRPRDRVLNLAVSNSNGMLYSSGSSKMSLINSTTENAKSHSDKSVQAQTLTSILESEGITDEIDYLNIDTEGTELEALQGLNFEKFRPKIISIEIHHRDIARALETESARYLGGLGYECVGCTVITYFFVDGNLNS